MSSKSKTCNRVIFYCKGDPESFKVDGKPVYASWPKLPHTNPDTAVSWADGHAWQKPSPHFTVEMPNEFTNARILDEINVRGQSSKVPQGVVYDKSIDAYLMFDFRTDGLVETMCNNSISKSVIKCKMAFRFEGANYYFVPRNGTTFTEYEKSFNATHNRPKGSSSTKIDIGVPFLGNFETYYVYLGQFKCTKDETEIHTYSNMPSYEDTKVHVYLRVASISRYGRTQVSRIVAEKDCSGVEEPYLTVTKSKMKVKSIVDKNDQEYKNMIAFYDNVKNHNSGVIKTEWGDKANYGHGAITEVDVDGTEITYTEKPKQQYNCNNRFNMSSFGGLFKKPF